MIYLLQFCKYICSLLTAFNQLAINTASSTKFSWDYNNSLSSAVLLHMSFRSLSREQSSVWLRSHRQLDLTCEHGVMYIGLHGVSHCTTENLFRWRESNDERASQVIWTELHVTSVKLITRRADDYHKTVRSRSRAARTNGLVEWIGQTRLRHAFDRLMEATVMNSAMSTIAERTQQLI